MTFSDWLNQLDILLINAIGLSYQDLPDACYADMYEDGYTPQDAVLEVINPEFQDFF